MLVSRGKPRFVALESKLARALTDPLPVAIPGTLTYSSSVTHVIVVLLFVPHDSSPGAASRA